MIKSFSEVTVVSHKPLKYTQSIKDNMKNHTLRKN